MAGRCQPSYKQMSCSLSSYFTPLGEGPEHSGGLST